MIMSRSMIRSAEALILQFLRKGTRGAVYGPILKVG